MIIYICLAYPSQTCLNLFRINVIRIDTILKHVMTRNENMMKYSKIWANGRKKVLDDKAIPWIAQLCTFLRCDFLEVFLLPSETRKQIFSLHHWTVLSSIFMFVMWATYLVLLMKLSVSDKLNYLVPWRSKSYQEFWSLDPDSG